MRSAKNKKNIMERKALEKIKKHPIIRVPARASVWYIATSALQRSVSVLGTPIFTRLLTAEEYGLFPLYNTWLGVITVIATLEITGSITLRGLQKHEKEKDEYISSSLGLISTVFLLVVGLYIPFRTTVNRITGLNTFITSVMFLQILMNAVINLYTQACKYEYKYKTVAALNIFSALGIPFISIAIIFLTSYRSEARIFAALAVSAIIAIPLVIGMLSQKPKLFNKGIWLYLIKSAIPLLPHYISMTAILRIGEIVIGRIHGTEALGKYSVALSVGMSLTVITNGLISAISPWILRKIASKELSKIQDLLLLSVKGLCLICLLILSVVPESVKIITPPEYHECFIAVYPLLLSTIPMFLSGALVTGQMFYEKSAGSSIPSFTAALISAGLSLFILPHVDYRFLSLFVLSSYITLFFLNSLLFKRLSGEYPIDIRKTSLIYVLCLSYSVVLLLLKDHTAARIVLALPLIPQLISVSLQALEEVREKT